MGGAGSGRTPSEETLVKRNTFKAPAPNPQNELVLPNYSGLKESAKKGGPGETDPIFSAWLDDVGSYGLSNFDNDVPFLTSQLWEEDSGLLFPTTITDLVLIGTETSGNVYGYNAKVQVEDDTTNTAMMTLYHSDNSVNTYAQFILATKDSNGDMAMSQWQTRDFGDGQAHSVFEHPQGGQFRINEAVSGDAGTLTAGKLFVGSNTDDGSGYNVQIVGNGGLEVSQNAGDWVAPYDGAFKVSSARFSPYGHTPLFTLSNKETSTEKEERLLSFIDYDVTSSYGYDTFTIGSYENYVGNYPLTFGAKNLYFNTLSGTDVPLPRLFIDENGTLMIASTIDDSSGAILQVTGDINLTGTNYIINGNAGATSGGAIAVYNDGSTSGQLSSITIEGGLITGYTTL
jgi:hypothetical protein